MSRTSWKHHKVAITRVHVLAGIVVLMVLVVMVAYYTSSSNPYELPKDKMIIEEAKEIIPSDLLPHKPPVHISYSYDVLLRRIEKNVENFWRFAKTDEKDDERKRILAAHRHSLLSDLAQLRKSDGRENFRKSEVQELSDVVQSRLAYIQNPGDCDSARKVACQLFNCGYGCQVHQLAICLYIAYATNRTMVLEDEHDRPYNDRLWSEIFLPWSSTCTHKRGASHVNWGPQHMDISEPAQVIHVPVTQNIDPIPDYVSSMAIPADLAPRMVDVLADPGVWWIGQLIKYLLRLQPQTQQMVDEMMDTLNILEGPIVGLQVRRTDKLIKEAEFHALEEYMVPVKDFYDKWDIGNPGQFVKRRVFIATDEPSVLHQAKEKYKDYEFLGNEQVVEAAEVSSRLSRKGLHGIILDTSILSSCNFVVCTFSSNVCRLVYEMKLARDPLAADSVYSLDLGYSLRFSMRMNLVLQQWRDASNLEVFYGDIVQDMNEYDEGLKGYSSIRKGSKRGRFPSFIFEYLPKVMDMPRY